MPTDNLIQEWFDILVNLCSSVYNTSLAVSEFLASFAFTCDTTGFTLQIKTVNKWTKIFSPDNFCVYDDVLCRVWTGSWGSTDGHRDYFETLITNCKRRKWSHLLCVDVVWILSLVSCAGQLDERLWSSSMLCSMRSLSDVARTQCRRLARLDCRQKWSDHTYSSWHRIRLFLSDAPGPPYRQKLQYLWLCLTDAFTLYYISELCNKHTDDVITL